MSKNSLISLEAHDNFSDPPAEMAARVLGLVRVAPGGAVERGDGAMARGRQLARGANGPEGSRHERAEAGGRRRGPGFWAAPDHAYPHTRHRRCRLHKAGSILNVLPKSVQPRAKQALQQIWMA